MLERNVVELQAATKHSDCPFVKHIVEILNKIYYDFFWVIFKAEFNVLLVLWYTIVTMSSKTSLLLYPNFFLYFENM